ncbi:SgcJ/EcaC family oxidoreductase [Blastococcus brunescens]|uniref:SgcJ/EcaC family oxidoreductase n=1 Tax=Blastococcus brunescens TaxID=1564165 RepID=A0ABZ1AW24_9ACTN|nr:SgcJ/EcaC family oxidoreductase [Blastococcus sp. BMG 8361]WRL61878.1 SgcJ/EcaC family oxidoreductase [Blastococcus sp. BMG 8361]
MSHPMTSMAAMRSFRRDPSVSARELPKGTVRRILGIARPYRRELSFFLALVVGSSLIGVITPLLAGNIVNRIASLEGTAGDIVRIALFIAGLAVVDAVISLATRWYSARIGEGVIYDLRSRVFEHVQRMPVAFFTRTQTGALVSRLNNDVIGAQQAFTSTLSGVVSNVIGLVLTAGVMLTLSWQITLLSLVLVPLFVLPARRIGRRLQEITRESYGLNASMNASMTERFNVAGALLVKLFGRPSAEAASFSDRAARVRDIGVLSAMYGRFFFTALTLVAALATALVYGLGGWLAFTGSLSPGDVVALALLLSRLYGPLTALANVRVDVMSAMVSFDRVFEVLDLAPMIAEAPDAVPVPADDRSIEFDAVSFSYPSASDVSLPSLEEVSLPEHGGPVDVLHDISFRVEPGQLVALVGHSGAGKSTIANLVPRLYDVTGGSVRVGGIDVRTATLDSLRDAIGVVSQDAHLFHDSIRANLLYARPDATEEELWAALEGARIAALVRSLPEGMDTVVGDRGYRMSGGEKQRLAIARVLLKAPGIVILDEATAHLDSESEVAVQHALDAALSGRTSLVIAHRLSTIRSADQILVIDKGRVVESGTHEQLLALGGGTPTCTGPSSPTASVERSRSSEHYRHSCPSTRRGVRSTVTAAHPHDAQIRALYHQFLDGWNRRSGASVAAGFADDGDIIGFDGSHHRGRLSIAADLRAIFGSHQTPAYVGIVRSVRPIAPGVAVLLAHAGMIPPGRTTSTPSCTRCTPWSRWTRGRPLAHLAVPVDSGGVPRLPEEREALTEELRGLLAPQ